MTREYVIEGTRISSIIEFYDEIDRALIPGVVWGRNMDALNDILRGGFGTPAEGFILVWRDAAHSKRMLGSQTFDQLIQIILDHGAGGQQEHDNVSLRLS